MAFTANSAGGDVASCCCCCYRSMTAWLGGEGLKAAAAAAISPKPILDEEKQNLADLVFFGL